MSHNVNITVNGITHTYYQGISLLNISRDFKANYKHDIILARVNGKLKELLKTVDEDAEIEFITTGDSLGADVYKRTASMVMLHAFEKELGSAAANAITVQYSLDKGYYCELNKDFTLSQELLDRVSQCMKTIVEDKIDIVKSRVTRKEAMDIFAEKGMHDKVNLFRFRRSSTVNIYRLEDTVDYYYGFMAPDTSYIRYFSLHLYDEGFVLQLPDVKKPTEVEGFTPAVKVFTELKQSTRWGELLKVRTVADINETIARGEFYDLVLVQEALQEKRIAQLAETIAKSGKRIVLIAGPSSSGKTTFSHRLSVQLRAHGLTPHPIPVDNYFVNREDTPIDEDGKLNYECLEAVDVAGLNRDFKAILAGERVEMPVFNFVAGKREYNGDYLQIGDKDVLVVEGIHSLNDAMTPAISADDKFKIYISALTQLNIDEHNRIPTTEARMLRRIVRDASKRGATAAKTISMWPSVRRGEDENIFPYQESCDAMFNSALIYELAILKQYAEPLLFSVGPDEPEYDMAQYLLKFLNYFLGVSSEAIPNNSIIREFIGGSCFNVG